MNKNKRIRGSLTLYVFLRLLVIICFILQIINKNYENAFLCVLTLLLFLIPAIIDKKFNIEVPKLLEIIVLLFIFSAEILGEINSFYTIFPHWDMILHTINGFIMGAIGFSLIDLLNNNDSFSLNLKPVYVAIFAFCFSMTIGVFWEFFEYGADKFLNLDMQKDTIVHKINSVTFDENNLNTVHTININTVSVNDEVWNCGGYLDIGLIDTMNDLLVNFIGAFTFSVLGYFYIKNRGKGKIVNSLILKRKKQKIMI